VPTCPPLGGKGGNANHLGGEAMTEVKFFEDFYCFEYQTSQGSAQRFHYYLYSPVYEFFPFVLSASTQWEYSIEATVFSSDFLPGRIFRDLKSSKRR